MIECVTYYLALDFAFTGTKGKGGKDGKNRFAWIRQSVRDLQIFVAGVFNEVDDLPPEVRGAQKLYVFVLPGFGDF